MKKQSLPRSITLLIVCTIASIQTGLCNATTIEKGFEISTMLEEPCLKKAWDALNRNDYQSAIEFANECIDLFLLDALILQKEIVENKRCSGPVGKVDADQKKCISEHGLLNDIGASYHIIGTSAKKLMHTAVGDRKIELKSLYDESANMACQLYRSRIWDPKGFYWGAYQSFGGKKCGLSSENLEKVEAATFGSTPTGEKDSLDEKEHLEPTSADLLSYDDALESLATELSDQLSQKGKRALAIYSFTNIQKERTSLGSIMAKELETDLARLQMNFKVVEREQLDQLITEMELSTSVITQRENVIKLGKILNIDVLVVGELYDWGETTRVNIQLLDTSTGEKFGGMRAMFVNTPNIQKQLETILPVNLVIHKD